jgi:hypothetical protein
VLKAIARNKKRYFFKNIVTFFQPSRTNRLANIFNMTKDLLITIDHTLAEKAAQYAEKEGKSLSILFEDYLRMIVLRYEKPVVQLTPIVSSLIGAAKTKFDYKEVLNNNLTNNHLQ